MGHTGIVKSPTYTLIEPYLINEHEIFHFDLYRLNSTDELEAIGLRDFFNGQGICLLEWPEKAEEFLGTPDLWIGIEYFHDQRLVELVAHSSTGSMIIKHIH
jgi:tRNA threonylcarbamoyladenosine biosynthesis protein TsaE